MSTKVPPPDTIRVLYTESDEVNTFDTAVIKIDELPDFPYTDDLSDLPCTVANVPTIAREALRLKTVEVPYTVYSVVAGREFDKNEIITYYDGEVVTASEYDKRIKIDPNLSTRSKRLLRSKGNVLMADFDANGNKVEDPAVSFAHGGIAAYIDGARKNVAANVQFVYLDGKHNQKQFQEYAKKMISVKTSKAVLRKVFDNEAERFGFDPTERYIAVCALRKINKDEHLFVDHGEDYPWALAEYRIETDELSHDGVTQYKVSLGAERVEMFKKLCNDRLEQIMSRKDTDPLIASVLDKKKQKKYPIGYIEFNESSEKRLTLQLPRLDYPELYTSTYPWDALVKRALRNPKLSVIGCSITRSGAPVQVKWRTDLPPADKTKLESAERPERINAPYNLRALTVSVPLVSFPKKSVYLLNAHRWIYDPNSEEELPVNFAEWKPVDTDAGSVLFINNEVFYKHKQYKGTEDKLAVFFVYTEEGFTPAQSSLRPMPALTGGMKRLKEEESAEGGMPVEGGERESKRPKVGACHICGQLTTVVDNAALVYCCTVACHEVLQLTRCFSSITI